MYDFVAGGVDRLRQGGYTPGEAGQPRRPKSQAKLTEARGQSAFRGRSLPLLRRGIGKEAVNELVDSMTKPNFVGKLIVILAGYRSNSLFLGRDCNPE